MYLILGIISLALTSWLMTFAVMSANSGARPRWLDWPVVMEILSGVAVAGFLFGLILPLVFLLNIAATPFGWLEALAALASASIGVAGAMLIRRGLRRVAGRPRRAPVDLGTPVRPVPATKPRRRAA